jgi:glycosyltransferase involved in cell wall biosynthesis
LYDDRYVQISDVNLNLWIIIRLKWSLTKNFVAPVALLISIYFPPEPGGGAKAGWNRALILHKMGYSVFVICGFPSYPIGRVTESAYRGKIFYIEKMENFTLVRLRLLPLASKGYLRRFILFINFIFISLIWMPKIIRICNKIELIYAITPTIFSSIIGYLYSIPTRSYFIYEVSDLWPEELLVFKMRLFFIVMYLGKSLAKLSYSLPDMLVATSNLAAKYLAINYSPKVMIHTMPIGVEPDKQQTRSSISSREELIGKKIFPSLVKDKFIVLYAGVISKVTRVENLVHAAHILKDSENSIIFLIIGQGDEKAKLEKEKSNSNISNLFFLPFQDASLVPSMISAADVCVVSLPPDPIYEVTVSTKFFDYLAYHKPQIGICGGELAHIITSNKIGMTVRDGQVDKLVDAILLLKNSPALVDSMKKNSIMLLHKFSLDTLASEFSLILKEERVGT